MKRCVRTASEHVHQLSHASYFRATHRRVLRNTITEVANACCFTGNAQDQKQSPYHQRTLLDFKGTASVTLVVAHLAEASENSPSSFRGAGEKGGAIRRSSDSWTEARVERTREQETDADFKEEMSCGHTAWTSFSRIRWKRNCFWKGDGKRRPHARKRKKTCRTVVQWNQHTHIGVRMKSKQMCISELSKERKGSTGGL